MATVTKIDAAHRLIVSAIELHLRCGDPLATHVIAASAFNLLRELMQTRGEHFSSKLLREGIFLSAKVSLDGVNVVVPGQDRINNIVTQAAEAIQSGTVTTANELPLEIDENEAGQMLGYVYQPYNFLKHANRDPDEVLDEAKANPVSAIMLAMTAMGWLNPKYELPESVAPFLDQYGLR